MLSKSVISYIQSLEDKKFRQKYQTFVVEGIKIANEVLKSDWEIEHIVCTASYANASSKILNAQQNKVLIAEEWELKKICKAKTPQEVLLVVKMKATPTHESTNDWIIALDGIQDPGNFGTIIRTAAWFGFQHLICSDDCADFYNSKVIQATMGSFLRVTVKVANLQTELSNAKCPIYGALLNGQSLNTVQFQKSGILLMGSEGKGIRPELKPYITTAITIPAYGAVESLNVAVATGIICNALAQQL